MLTAPQEKVPDMVFETYLVTARFMLHFPVPRNFISQLSRWPFKQTEVVLSTTDQSLFCCTASGHHGMFEGAVLSGIEKKCSCQWYLFTASRMSHYSLLCLSRTHQNTQWKETVSRTNAHLPLCVFWITVSENTILAINCWKIDYADCAT